MIWTPDCCPPTQAVAEEVPPLGFVDPNVYAQDLSHPTDQSDAWQKALDDGYALMIPPVGPSPGGFHRIQNINLSQAIAATAASPMLLPEADQQIRILCAGNANIKPVKNGSGRAFIGDAGDNISARFHLEGGVWNNFDHIIYHPDQFVNFFTCENMRTRDIKEVAFYFWTIRSLYYNCWFRQHSKTSHDATGIAGSTTANIMTFISCRWDNFLDTSATGGAFAPTGFARGAQYNFYDAWFEGNEGNAIYFKPGTDDEFNGIYIHGWFETNHDNITSGDRADIVLDASTSGASLGNVVIDRSHFNISGSATGQNSRIQAIGDVGIRITDGFCHLRATETLLRLDGTGGTPDVIVDKIQFNNIGTAATYHALVSAQVSGAVPPRFVRPHRHNILGVIDKGHTTEYEAGIVASTTHTQAGGTPLLARVNEVATVASTNDSVTMWPAHPGADIWIKNNDSSILQNFPASGDAIDGNTVDLPMFISPGDTIHLHCAEPGMWES